MPILKHHSSSQSWLIGVPQKTAGVWWRFIFWPYALGRHNVPEYFRSAGMYCPVCRKGQKFSDRCASCRCEFSCYIVIGPESQPHETVSSGTAKQGICHRLPAPLHAILVQLGKASLRARVMALCVISLLLISLAVGFVQHRKYVRKQYAHNYVQALYVIKSGMNLGEMVCNGTYNDWRGVESTAAPETGGMHPQARADMESVKTEINKIMGELGAPSAEYSQAAQSLQKLYALYDKTNLLVINFPDSLSQHKAEIVAAKEEFSREIKVLKANLPAPIAEELGKAGQKYDLRFMARGK